jgi:hypothetical protein
MHLSMTVLEYFGTTAKLPSTKRIEMAPIGKPKRRIGVEPLPERRHVPEPAKEPLPVKKPARREKVPA